MGEVIRIEIAPKYDENDIFFFFKQKTAYEIKECDWSSDVCSSDLRLERDTKYDA